MFADQLNLIIALVLQKSIKSVEFLLFLYVFTNITFLFCTHFIKFLWYFQLAILYPKELSCSYTLDHLPVGKSILQIDVPID